MPTKNLDHRSGIALVIGAAVLVSSAGVLAQTAPAPPAPAVSADPVDDLFQVDQRNPVNNTTGSFFSGLPLPAFGYSIRASLLSEYQSNFLRIPDGVATPAGKSKSDFRLTPLLSGDVNLPFGRQSLFASAVVGKDFYTKNQGYDRQRILLSGGANLAAGSSCTATLSGNFVQQQSNSNSSLVNIPNTQTTTSYGATAQCGGISGITPSLTYHHTKATNDSLARQLYDLKSNSYSGSLGYARPGFGVVSLFASRNANNYYNQTYVIGNETVTRGVDVTNIGIQYQRAITTQFNANASLSRVHVVPTLPFQSPTSSLGYSLSINYVPPTRISASIVASRNASSSPNSSSLFYVQQAFSGTITYRLRTTLDVKLGASTSLRTYDNAVSIPGSGQLISDRLNNFRLSVNWAPIQNGTLSTFVAQANRGAEPSTYNYKNTIVGVLISYGI